MHEKDVDDPAAPLDLQDLKGLGGLVGLAAIVVMAFALFPEELNTALGGLTENTSLQGMTMGYFHAASPNDPPGPDLPVQPGYQDTQDPAYDPRSRYPDSETSRSRVREREREYLADEGILPSWAEGLPEEQWWETKSHKEISKSRVSTRCLPYRHRTHVDGPLRGLVLVCRIKPWLCDDDGLPIVKPVSRKGPPQQRAQVTQQVVREKSESVVTETSVETAG